MLPITGPGTAIPDVTDETKQRRGPARSGLPHHRNRAHGGQSARPVGPSGLDIPPAGPAPGVDIAARWAGVGPFRRLRRLFCRL